jgi:2-succinyl-6-hydroxy-2,4-cyclohexadiene-1-carboxylate synthase
MKVLRWGNSGGPALICLHGFMGEPADWNSFASSLLQRIPNLQIVAPALPQFADITESLISFCDAEGISEATIIGYSLGGRLGLKVALTCPERFPCFIGVSTTAGIADPTQRAQRKSDDFVLAARLRGITTETDWREFLLEWWNLPVFASPARTDALKEAFIASRIHSEPNIHAENLERWSPGALPSLWSELSTYSGRAVFLSGEGDTKYQHIALRMARAVRNGQCHVLQGCGHQMLLEKPDAVAERVADALNYFSSFRGGG